MFFSEGCGPPRNFPTSYTWEGGHQGKLEPRGPPQLLPPTFSLSVSNKVKGRGEGSLP